MTTVTTSRRIPGLDGPRGIACLCVMSVHVIGFFATAQLENQHLTYLSEAIVFFFALSGFLIYLPFVRTYAASQRRPELRRYAVQRLFRIYPGYIVIFLIANLVMGAVYLDNAADAARMGTDRGTGRITAPLRLLEQVTLVQNLRPGGLQTGIAPSWSLTTELSFYLVMPVLAVLFLRKVRGRPRMAMALVPPLLFAAGGLVGKVAVAHFQVDQHQSLSVNDAEFGANAVAVLARSIVVLADNFAYGMAAAVLFVWFERGDLNRVTPGLVRLVCTPVVVAFGLLALAYSTVGWTPLGVGGRVTGSCLAVASGALIVLISEPTARGRDSLLARILDVAPLRYVGTISLSVYLWHYPVILLAARWGLHPRDDVAGMLVSLAAVWAGSLALGSASYRFVEAPAMRFAARLTRSRVRRDRTAPRSLERT